jgi:hypothetical protein
MVAAIHDVSSRDLHGEIEDVPEARNRASASTNTALQRMSGLGRFRRRLHASCNELRRLNYERTVRFHFFPQSVAERSRTKPCLPDCHRQLGVCVYNLSRIARDISSDCTSVSIRFLSSVAFCGVIPWSRIQAASSSVSRFMRRVIRLLSGIRNGLNAVSSAAPTKPSNRRRLR